MATSFAGSFLVARPSLRDPNFGHSVVLLLAHNEEGAYGVIVNRPRKVNGMPFPIFGGGPCESPGFVMLHAEEEWLELEEDPDDAGPEDKTVARGIFLGDAACLAQAAEPPPGVKYQFRIFAGYAGWGPGQLEREIAEGSWGLLPADGDVLFGTPARDLWERLVPPPIPQPSLN